MDVEVLQTLVKLHMYGNLLRCVYTTERFFVYSLGFT